jgi:hypothetical protein
MVTVEYRIDPTDAAAFLETLRTLTDARRRDGAFAWGIFEDVGDPGRYLEYFMEDSWLEHLRHHERVTALDRDIEARVRAFHLGPEPPAMQHWLSEPPERE